MAALKEAELKEKIFQAFKEYDFYQNVEVERLKQELFDAYRAHGLELQKIPGRIKEADGWFDRAYAVRIRRTQT